MMTWFSSFFNSPSSMMMEQVILMHDYVMMFMVSILMGISTKFLVIMSSSKLNMEFYENQNLETIWTILPFLILMFIAIPSLKTLYLLDSCSFCGTTMKITGHQWYWTYETKMAETKEFNSYMVPESHLRLLETDNRAILPTNIPVRVLTTSQDVIHSWTIPSMGVKMDAVPGRINQFCMTFKKSGIYLGQCSEICGSNHSFMPIMVESHPM